MELTCTKKLLDYIGIKPGKATAQIDPLFGWTANLMVIDRRKTLVVVHVASRCAFVLYGLTVKDLRKLPDLVIDGVRGLLESEYVRPEIIEMYLDDLGREVSFWANSSPKVVASCNKACERVKLFSDLLRPGELFQRSVLPRLNDDILPRGGYVFAYQALVGQLQERYGADIQSCRAFEFQVSMELHSPCERRIIVPADLDLYQFHNVLQACFAWEDCHLHEFVVEVDAAGHPTMVIRPPWDEPEEWPGVQIRNSMDVTLEEVFASRKKIVYEYDFGDGWIHIIELCRVIDDHRGVYPQCTLALGDAPMEDCGGPGGFAHVMRALNDHDHPEHREVSEWVRQSWWHPLDKEWIDSRVKDAHRRISNW